MLTDYVYGLYDNMLADSILGARLKAFMQTAPHDAYMKHLKDRTVDYLEVVWGGDNWEGQDLFAAHMHLQITPDMFDRCIKCGAAKLKAMKVSSGITKEVLEEMKIMKEPITDPQGKFRRWVETKNKELEARSSVAAEGLVDISGMGFTTSPETVKLWAEKEQKEKERRERLAAMRAGRKQTAKEESEPGLKKNSQRAKEASEAGEKKHGQMPKNVSGHEKTQGTAKTKSKQMEASTSKAIEPSAKVYPAEWSWLPEDGLPPHVPDSVVVGHFLQWQCCV